MNAELADGPMPAAVPRPRVGRPRSDRVEGAILDAALELLVEDGAGRVSIEAIAERAGVGKATIYRRWRGKEDLLVDAVQQVTERPISVHTEDLRSDLIEMADHGRRTLAQNISGKIMPRLMSAALDNPELMQCYWKRAMVPRRAVLVARLQAAIDTGELRPGLDAEMLGDAIVGPMVYRKLYATCRPLPTREFVEGIVDFALEGARPR